MRFQDPLRECRLCSYLKEFVHQTWITCGPCPKGCLSERTTENKHFGKNEQQLKVFEKACCLSCDPDPKPQKFDLMNCCTQQQRNGVENPGPVFFVVFLYSKGFDYRIFNTFLFSDLILEPFFDADMHNLTNHQV